MGTMVSMTIRPPEVAKTGGRGISFRRHRGDTVSVFVSFCLFSGHVMRVQSSGRQGDQVALTSVLYEFQSPLYIIFDYRLEESTPGTRSTLSVHLLSKHRVPTRLPELIESHIDEGWTRSYVEIPRGTYHVMFLVTLGLPYHSDVYLDKIELSPTILGWKPTYSIAKPTGNLRQFYSDPNGMCILFLSTTACVQTVY